MLMTALTIVVSLAICAVAAGVMAPVVLGRYADTVLVVGSVGLVGALLGLGLLLRRRDRPLW
jgi:hypothetical protein